MTWCGSDNLKSESICDNIVVYLVSQTWLLLVYALFLHLRLEGHLPKNNQVFAVERSNESNQPEFPKNCQDNANCKLSHAMKNELLAGVILYGPASSVHLQKKIYEFNTTWIFEGIFSFLFKQYNLNYEQNGIILHFYLGEVSLIG